MLPVEVHRQCQSMITHRGLQQKAPTAGAFNLESSTWNLRG